MATITEAMSGFRAALNEVESARTALSAVVKASTRGNPSVVAAMAPVIASQVESLSAAMRVAQEALAAVVQAAQPVKPEPEKKPKAA